MIKKIGVLLIVVLMASSCAQIEAHTVRQRYFALKADYRNVLQIAVGYKSVCDKNPVVDKCHGVVAKIQSYDAKINTTFTLADIAIRNEDTPRAEKALMVGASLITEVSNYMINQKD